MATKYSPKMVTDGLVLSLDAANTKSYPRSGTTWTDLSGNSNTGTLTNGPTFNAGNLGSIVFDGTNDYVGIPYNSILAPTSQISYGAWAFLSNWNITNDSRLLSKTQSGGEFTGLDMNFLNSLLNKNGNFKKYSSQLTNNSQSQKSTANNPRLKSSQFSNFN